MSYTILYERLDGTYFVGSLFHPRMEHAGVTDPADGKTKVFRTVFGFDGVPIKRVEVGDELQE